VRVIDKLLASKPHERFQTAQEAAEALQAVCRPKPRPAAVRSDAKGASGVSPSPKGDGKPPQPVAPAHAATPERVVVKVAPKYPGWFRPLAGLAERRPGLALAALIAALAGASGAGFLLGRLLR
jgi:hypothetical protein